MKWIFGLIVVAIIVVLLVLIVRTGNSGSTDDVTVTETPIPSATVTENAVDVNPPAPELTETAS